MAYSLYTDVMADFKDLPLTTTSLVTIANVTQFIVEADAVINSYVGMKYSVPVTADASALALLQMFSRTLVRDRIKSILESKQQTNSSANQAVAGAYSTRDVMSALKDIKAGNLALSGATALVSGGGFYSENYSEDVEPTFDKDEKQW